MKILILKIWKKSVSFKNIIIKETFYLCVNYRINSRAGVLSSMDNINNTNLGAMDTIDEEHSTGEEDYVF